MHTPGPPIDQELLKAKLTTDALYLRLAARRYLRIPVTVVSLLVCVMPIAFWGRSYTYLEKLDIRPVHPGAFRILQQGGCVSIGLNGENTSFDEYLDGTGFYDTEEADFMNAPLPSWDIEATDSHFYVTVPIWFLVILFATIAALPWIKWHFSLRTLLIVMTLLSLFFGAIAMSH